MFDLPDPFKKQGQQLCNDGNTTLFFDAYNVDQMLEAYRQGIAAQQAQPEPVNAMLLEALEAAEKLEHAALVALSEATYELKVGNTYTTATDTYKANNELIHRLDKILNLQYRDRKRTALTAAKQAQAEPVNAMLVEALKDALVYVAHIGHGTPQHMCPKGVTLFDADGVEVKLPDGRVVHAGRTPEYLSNKALTAAQQAQPERAPLSEAELEQEFCNIAGLETGINPAAADTKRALVWFKKGYAHGIKQGGQHD